MHADEMQVFLVPGAPLETLDFPYRPKVWSLFLACLFFGAMAWFMGKEGLENDRGLVINGLIRLGPVGATRFYGSIAVVAGLFVLAGLCGLLMTVFTSHRVLLGPDHLSAPKFGFSRQPTLVSIDKISHLEIQEIHNQRFLNIHHPGGKLSVQASFLPNQGAFEELCSALAQRIRPPRQD